MLYVISRFSFSLFNSTSVKISLQLCVFVTLFTFWQQKWGSWPLALFSVPAAIQLMVKMRLMVTNLVFAVCTDTQKWKHNIHQFHSIHLVDIKIKLTCHWKIYTVIYVIYQNMSYFYIWAFKIKLLWYLLNVWHAVVVWNVAGRVTNMACAACIIGIGVGVGGIFLYRVLRQWLRKFTEQLSSSDSVEHIYDNGSVESIAGAYSSCKIDVRCYCLSLFCLVWSTGNQFSLETRCKTDRKLLTSYKKYGIHEKVIEMYDTWKMH